MGNFIDALNATPSDRIGGYLIALILIIIILGLIVIEIINAIKNKD